MKARRQGSVRFGSVRPLVRYVDDEQAVIEASFTLRKPVDGRSRALPEKVEVLIEAQSSDGFYDEQILTVDMNRGRGQTKLDLVRPDRWWPAGMGEQSLYEFAIHLLKDDDVVDTWESTVGLTSVRARRDANQPDAAHLIINGQECEVEHFVAVDEPDEHGLLPVAGHSVIVVRGHYGPDVLYDAADRAGIMLIQCVPLDADGKPQDHVAEQVDRLSSHPSLVGWCVGHLGPLAGSIHRRLKALDPTRNVFGMLPHLDAA